LRTSNNFYYAKVTQKNE